jgi:lipopolysaccharide transport system permease protein
MLAWNLVAGGIQRGGASLVSDSRLITKVYFPRAVLPIAATVAVLVDFVVALVAGFCLFALQGYEMGPTLLVLPLVALLALVLTIGLGLLFSALNVYYRDFMYALPFLLQLWLYASPIVYSSSMIPPEYRVIYGLNPLVGIIDGFRWAFFGGSPPIEALGEAMLVGTALFVLGAVVFRRVERHFADVI